MNLVDIILEELLLRLNISASPKEEKEYKETLTPLIESTVTSCVIETLSPEEVAMLNKETMTEEEFQLAIYELSTNPSRQEAISKALEELVDRLVKLPNSEPSPQS